MTNNSSGRERNRWEFIVLACMFMGYMAFILAKTALTVASPEMLKDPALGLDDLPLAPDTPPAWAAEAAWYEIDVDRFRNGDPDNDPTPAAVAAATVRAIRSDVPELLVNRPPMRPTIALGEVSPRLRYWLLRHLGVNRAFQRVVEHHETIAAQSDS